MLSFRCDRELFHLHELAKENNQLLKRIESISKEPRNNFGNNLYNRYLELWDSNLFLHEMEDAIHLKLSDVYVVPNYHDINGNKNYDLDFQIKCFLQHNTTWQTLIILGDPGVGKTSLISYICSLSSEQNNPIVLKFQSLNIDIMKKIRMGY